MYRTNTLTTTGLASIVMTILATFVLPVLARLRALGLVVVQSLYGRLTFVTLYIPGPKRRAMAQMGFHWGVYIVLVLIVVLIFALQAFISQYLTGLTAWVVSVVVGAGIATFILFMVGHGAYGARPGAGSR